MPIRLVLAKAGIGCGRHSASKTRATGTGPGRDDADAVPAGCLPTAARWRFLHLLWWLPPLPPPPTRIEPCHQPRAHRCAAILDDYRNVARAGRLVQLAGEVEFTVFPAPLGGLEEIARALEGLTWWS